MGRNIETLDQHLLKVREGSRRFENAFQSVSRMILEKGFDKVQVNGNVTYDFHIFREGKKHLIGMYDEITSLVSFVDDGAKGGPARELAFVLVGEPGNGKTFFVDALCTKYIEFISKTENQRLTFRFKGLKELGDQYGNIEVIESQTYEDPMVLAMNLAGHNIDANKEWLIEKGFNETQIENFFLDYRPLGACSDYILNDIRQHNDGNLDMMLRHIEIVPIPLSPTRGVLVGKYAPKDKITAKSSDLLGEEDLKRMLKIADANNPYLYNVKKGALARVAGGGIHFSDEIFKNKRDLVLVYLSVIQNRTIELDGYKWPMDTLIIATSNNAEYGDFQSLETEAPVIDRTLIVNMAHNTNHELQ
ncbi:serine protein kinase, partial [Candidatus Woesearchaeota archaeon CG08_land_8_20_14_0_20_43_7]